MRLPLAALALALPATSLLPSFSLTAPQKRVEKEEKQKGFPAHMKAAEAAFAAEHWGECASELQKALSIAMEKRRDAIVAALPDPGEGWTKRTSSDDMASMMAAMAITGFMVQCDYGGPEGQSLDVTANIGSPMIQMLGMQFSNPAFRDENTELIEYEKHKALLTKNGDDRFQLQILMGADLVQVESRGLSDDALLGIFSEAAVQKIEAALGL